MKHAILVIALFFFASLTHAQDTTTAVVAPVDSSKPAKATPAPAPAVNQDSLRHAVDSATFYNTLNYQMAQPEVLYAHTTKRFLPVFIITLIVMVSLCTWLLFKTGLCKDLSYDPETNLLRPAKIRPYSYARVQLFWWTLIILSCFITFFFYTGQLVAFNSTVVLLLGGGLAVSIFGSVIDNSQIQENGTSVPIRHQDLDPTKGFFADILSDEGGISIHRFQAVMFNIVFGMAFLHSFYALITTRPPQYPFIEFEPWQLTLLGISAAGYLGFKANENSAATKTQRQIHAVTKTNLQNEPMNEMEIATEQKTKPAYKTMAFQNLKTNILQKTISAEPKQEPGDGQ